MAKPHYKLAVLVLASEDRPIYTDFRQIWLQYYQCHPDVLVHFAFGDSATTKLGPRDFLFRDIPENYIPGMARKTLRAMRYIREAFEFDHFLRTNLSTFWVWHRALERIQALPRTGLFAGTPRSCAVAGGGTSPIYVSGVDQVITPDLVDLALSRSTHIAQRGYAEDWAMTDFFREQGIQPRYSNPRNIHILEHLPALSTRSTVLQEIAQAEQLSCDHYRIKNSNRTEVDPLAARTLLEYYYGKSSPTI
jgi:hypothetical protein